MKRREKYDNSVLKYHIGNIMNMLPDGTGYKSCWMVVEGCNQMEIANTLLDISEQRRCDYHDALGQLGNANSYDKMIMITADYNCQNYVIGHEISSIFYEYDSFIQKISVFPKVYVYMTNRVSDCHGFAVFEYGSPVRLYSYDEEKLRSIGMPLKEELEMNLQLPQNFEEVRNYILNDISKLIDEEIIIKLAKKQTGIDIENYPYDDVIIGKFETNV